MTGRTPAADPRSRHGEVHGAVVDTAVVAAGLVVCSWLHNLAGTDVNAATANARALQSAERSLHIDVELSVNRWLTGRPLLANAAALYYRLYYVPLAAVLVWVLIRQVKVYATVRRTLTVMAPPALLTFRVLPVSPPRFSLAGIPDTVAEHDIIGSGASRDLTDGRNHFSAMPSLHVGWSALGAYAAWLALRSRFPRWALLVWLLPLTMVAVVIATGNHYVLDVVGSGVLLALSIAGGKAWGR